MSQPEPAHCPPESLLRRLGAEWLDDDIFGAIETHVEECPACQGRMEEFVQISRVGLLPESNAGGFDELPGVPGFSIVRELGRGAAGVVYLAREDETQRLVALKMIPGGWISGPRGRARWLAEARAVASVNDTHIVRLYRVEERPQFYLMVFEFVQGGTLGQRLKGPLPPRQAVMIVRTLASALGKIHEAGLLHLDLKPSNILVDGQPDADWPDLTLKISDFGIARLIQWQNPQESTVTGPRGTPAFMAPEQAEADQKRIGKSTDIYSLGVIFYLLLSGRLPFDGRSTLEILDRVRFQAPERLLKYGNFIDSGLERICQRCLAKQAAERFDSADKLVEALDAWLAGVPDVLNAGNRRPILRLAKIVFLLISMVGLFGYCGRQVGIGRVALDKLSAQAPVDHAEWVYRLTREPEGFDPNQLEQLLTDSRMETAKNMSDSTIAPSQLANEALLLKNMALRLNNRSNKNHIEISIWFLDLASTMFHESYRRNPADQRLLRELVHCETTYSTIHSGFSSEISSAQDDLQNKILDHLSSAATLIPKLDDRRTRLFHEIKLLDYCRFYTLIFKAAGQDAIASRIQDFQASCIQIFQEDRDIPDLAAWLSLTKGQFPESAAQETWLIPEDGPRLKWNWVAYQISKQVFDKVVVNQPETDQGLMDWTRVLIDRTITAMKSHEMDPSILPRIAMMDLNRHLLSVSTHLRMSGGLRRADQVEKSYSAIANEICRRFPADAFAILVSSEAHLQRWKNQLRHNNPEAALAALRQSMLEARRAAEMKPDLAVARDMADDREARIARFLSKKSNLNE